jgi:hypothetical protein
MIPVAIISKLKDANNPGDAYFENGVLKTSANVMLATLKEILGKNMRKKVKSLTEDQWIEIFESCEEMQTINYELAKKNNVRDIIRNMTKNLPISQKFDTAKKQIDDKLPRLTSVLAQSFTDKTFIKSLSLFNAEKNTKVQYTVDVLLSQLIQFTNSVIQNKENGYNGYTVKVSQLDSFENSTKASSDNPDFLKYSIKIKVEIEHLDITSIEMTEEEAVHKDYTKSLGLFVCFTNEKVNLS